MSFRTKRQKGYPVKNNQPNQTTATPTTIATRKQARKK